MSMPPPVPRIPKPPKKAKSYRLEPGLWAQIELQRRAVNAKRKEGEAPYTESDMIRRTLRLSFPERKDASALAKLLEDGS